MKKCTECGLEYGTGDQVREKCRAKYNKRIQEFEQLLISIHSKNPSAINELVELTKILSELPEEELKSALNDLQNEISPLRIIR